MALNVIWLDDPASGKREQVGGKTANLNRIVGASDRSPLQFGVCLRPYADYLVNDLGWLKTDVTQGTVGIKRSTPTSDCGWQGNARTGDAAELLQCYRLPQ